MSLDNFLDALTTTHGVSIVDDDHAQQLYLRCLAEVSGHTILDDYSAQKADHMIERIEHWQKYSLGSGATASLSNGTTSGLDSHGTGK
eukprot:593411-Karenia_brevis.AAC.1